MPRSSARGKNTSATEVEVLGLTPHALWVLVGGHEYMLDFERFPWFQEASIQEASRVELRFDHLYWPALDVDLHVDSVSHPEQFPMVAKSSAKTPKA
jgi:hypothetical protein